jgi:hypothetical protein
MCRSRDPLCADRGTKGAHCLLNASILVRIFNWYLEKRAICAQDNSAAARFMRYSPALSGKCAA